MNIEPIAINTESVANILPAFVYDKEEAKEFGKKVQFGRCPETKELMVNPGWLRIRPDARGTKGKCMGLVAINQWDSNEKEVRDYIICDGDELVGTPSYISCRIEFNALAKKGHTFNDNNES